MEENVKSAKFKLSITDLMPILALAGAALSFIFTFLIGITVNNVQSVDYYFYHYFDSEFVNSYKLLEGAQLEASRSAIIFGLVVCIIGLIAVLASTGLTCYAAVRKYKFKGKDNIEKYSLCTYFSYILFAGAYYSLNYVKVQSDTLTVTTGYNAATIVGIIAATAVMCAYVVLKVVSKSSLLKSKQHLADLIYSLASIAVLAVIIGLLTAPAVFVNETVAGAIDSPLPGSHKDAISASTHYSFGFIQLIAYGALSSDVTDMLISSASFGFVISIALSILFTFLIVKLISTLLGKKKNENVLYAICFAASLVMLFFSAVAGGYFTDLEAGYIKSLKDMLTGAGAEITNSSATINVAFPITIFAVSLVAFVLAVAHPYVLTFVAKKDVNEPDRIENGEVLLEVKNLCKHFVIGKDFFGRPTKTLKAVDNVTFKLKKGKTLGIVGESGCGKTTMGRTVLRLYDVTSGEVWFKGQKVSSLRNREFDRLRPDMQMIFQDPYASLSPRLTVGEIIGEAVKQHKIVPKEEYHDYILSVMKMCGLQPHYFERYPHEFSGGQRQRICIARALALKPELVVCDEPVSALDVSIQAQIINMLIELRKSLGLTYVFISHDLSVVKHISDEVGVMYLGSLVEYGSKQAIFENTLHPYTRALFSAVPVPDPDVKMNRIILKGDIPSPVNPPKGCKFHTRCDSCMEICGRVAPLYKEVEPGHFCACHLYNTEEDTKQLELNYAREQELAAEEAVKQENKNFWHKVCDKFKKKPLNEEAELPEAEDVHEE